MVSYGYMVVIMNFRECETRRASQLPIRENDMIKF